MNKRFLSKNIVLIQFIFSFIIVAVVSFFVNYFTALSMQTMEDNIRQRIIAVSKILSQYASPDELDQYQNNKDMELPEYKQLGYRLQSFIHENDVASAYFVRVEDDKIQYIIHSDSSSENPIGLNTPPYEFRKTDQWIKKVLQEQSASSGLGFQSLGTEDRMTAFSPVLDYDKQVVALA